MNSLVSRIKNYLQNWYAIDPEHWENGGEIERLALNAGRKASNASRTLRKLTEDGIIEHKYNAKGHVEYRFRKDGV